MEKLHFISSKPDPSLLIVSKILCIAFVFWGGAYFQFPLSIVIVYGNKMRHYHLLFYMSLLKFRLKHLFFLQILE